MNRLLIYINNDDISNIVNTHLKYYEDMIVTHTKKYISKVGTFYVTKFNPDVSIYEQYYKHPSTITKKLTKRQKEKLQRVLLAASGLKLEKHKDFERIEDNGELVGLSFRPLSTEMIDELIKELE